MAAQVPTAEWEPITNNHPEANVPDSTPPSDGLPSMEPENTVPPEEPTPQPEAEKQDEDVLEVILPSAEPREQAIRDLNGEVIKVYTQKPLSYFRKMAFFKLLAKGLRRIVDEGGPEAIGELFAGPIGDRNLASLAQSDFDDAGSFMRFVTAIVEEVPDILEESYVVWLAIPPGQREWAKAAMRGDLEDVQPLNDEDGVEILKVFVVQNWEAMQRFFRVHAREVMDVARAEQRRIGQDES